MCWPWRRCGLSVSPESPPECRPEKTKGDGRRFAGRPAPAGPRWSASGCARLAVTNHAHAPSCWNRRGGASRPQQAQPALGPWDWRRVGFEIRRSLWPAAVDRRRWARRERLEWNPLRRIVCGKLEPVVKPPRQPAPLPQCPDHGSAAVFRGSWGGWVVCSNPRNHGPTEAPTSPAGCRPETEPALKPHQQPVSQSIGVGHFGEGPPVNKNFGPLGPRPRKLVVARLVSDHQ